jgi:hypothetical protein
MAVITNRHYFFTLIHYSARNLSWSETEGGICLVFREKRTAQAYALVILAKVPALYITPLHGDAEVGLVKVDSSQNR